MMLIRCQSCMRLVVPVRPRPVVAAELRTAAKAGSPAAALSLALRIADELDAVCGDCSGAGEGRRAHG